MWCNPCPLLQGTLTCTLHTLGHRMTISCRCRLLLFYVLILCLFFARCCHVWNIYRPIVVRVLNRRVLRYSRNIKTRNSSTSALSHLYAQHSTRLLIVSLSIDSMHESRQHLSHVLFSTAFLSHTPSPPQISGRPSICCYSVLLRFCLSLVLSLRSIVSILSSEALINVATVNPGILFLSTDRPSTVVVRFAPQPPHIVLNALERMDKVRETSLTSVLNNLSLSNSGGVCK